MAPLLAVSGAVLIAWSVWAAGMDPTAHVYPAMMRALAVWIGADAAAGSVMQLSCLAGCWFGKLTPDHDADLWNVMLFWHFAALMTGVAAATIGIVPRLL